MIEVFAVKIETDINTLLSKKLIECLPRDRQEKILSYRNHYDAIRSIVAGMLLQSILYKYLGPNYNNNVLLKNKYGKLYVNSEHNIHFNLSHSGSWVVCVTDHTPVGIDIEEIKPIDLEIAKHFFSKSEYQDLMNTELDRRISYFYELWTLKESYLKAIGKGLSIPLDSFSMQLDIVGWKPIKNNDELYFFKQYEIDKDYKMAVCAKNKNFSEKVNIISQDYLCKVFFYLQENRKNQFNGL